MLDASLNQAAGLRLIARQNAARVIAMATHGDQRDELPLLWTLCNTLVESGYPVAVLDATTVESERNPGLSHLLEDKRWVGDDADDHMPWSVIPSARGFETLAAIPFGADHHLQRLAGLLPRYGVLVIYAPTDVLVAVLANSGIMPLLAVSAAQQSLVTAYQALKHLLLDAKLKPTIAFILPPHAPKQNQGSGHAISQRLQACAMTYLGHQIDSQHVPAPQWDELAGDEMNRLSMRLLEAARPLCRNQALAGWTHEADVQDNLAGSH